MSPRFLQACESFQSAEKACWEILLREMPDVEPFPPEVLDAAIERTLTQLWQMLREAAPERRVEMARALPPVLPSRQTCPVRAHLPYFQAGTRALELIAREVEATHPEYLENDAAGQREELAVAFELLVQSQLEALCLPCVQAGECRYSDRPHRVALQDDSGRRRARRATSERRGPRR